MKCHPVGAAAAACLFLALATAQPPVGAQQAPAPQPGAGKGYPLTTKDGRCAVWVSSDEAPRPGETTTWSGSCKDGMAHGFGIQEIGRADGGTGRYVGHMLRGQWHGLGREHSWDAQGRLIYVDEGVFQNGRREGVFKELILEHPLNGPIQGFREQGRDLGSTYVAVQQFFFNDEVKLLCSRDADCAQEAISEGHTLKDADLGDGMNRALPYGGWEFEILSGEQSARTGNQLQMGKPLSIGMCLEAAQVRKGSEPRLGALLFPSYSAWTAYLRADQQCEDLSASQVGDQLRWTSQCQPADRSELVSIDQQRSFSAKELKSRTEATVTRGGKFTARATKEVTARFVGACTDDMIRAGQLGL